MSVRKPRLPAVAVGMLLVGLPLAGCGLGGGELAPRMTRLTSPDGRADLVLTWRGGGGAAGWSEQHVALVARGAHAGERQDQATLDPEALVGARWLSNDVAEIGLDGAVDSGSLPTVVHVAHRAISLRVRDFRRCQLAAFENLPMANGPAIHVEGWDCGGGVGRLHMSWQEGGVRWELVDAAVHWPTSLNPTIRGNHLSIPARRLYRDDTEAQVGGPDGRTLTVSWAGGS